eukprot:tig00000704_g3291.t1
MEPRESPGPAVALVSAEFGAAAPIAAHAENQRQLQRIRFVVADVPGVTELLPNEIEKWASLRNQRVLQASYAPDASRPGERMTIDASAFETYRWQANVVYDLQLEDRWSLLQWLSRDSDARDALGALRRQVDALARALEEEREERRRAAAALEAALREAEARRAAAADEAGGRVAGLEQQLHEALAAAAAAAAQERAEEVERRLRGELAEQRRAAEGALELAAAAAEERARRLSDELANLRAELQRDAAGRADAAGQLEARLRALEARLDELRREMEEQKRLYEEEMRRREAEAEALRARLEAETEARRREREEGRARLEEERRRSEEERRRRDEEAAQLRAMVEALRTGSAAKREEAELERRANQEAERRAREEQAAEMLARVEEQDRKIQEMAARLHRANSVEPPPPGLVKPASPGSFRRVPSRESLEEEAAAALERVKDVGKRVGDNLDGLLERIFQKSVEVSERRRTIPPRSGSATRRDPSPALAPRPGRGPSSGGAEGDARSASKAELVRQRVVPESPRARLGGLAAAGGARGTPRASAGGSEDTARASTGVSSAGGGDGEH